MYPRRLPLLVLPATSKFHFSGVLSSIPHGFLIRFNTGPGIVATKFTMSPEPATLGLTGIGVAAMLARRRRKF